MVRFAPLSYCRDRVPSQLVLSLVFRGGNRRRRGREDITRFMGRVEAVWVTGFPGGGFKLVCEVWVAGVMCVGGRGRD